MGNSSLEKKFFYRIGCWFTLKYQKMVEQVSNLFWKICSYAEKKLPNLNFGVI